MATTTAPATNHKRCSRSTAALSQAPPVYLVGVRFPIGQTTGVTHCGDSFSVSRH